MERLATSKARDKLLLSAYFATVKRVRYRF